MYDGPLIGYLYDNSLPMSSGGGGLTNGGDIAAASKLVRLRMEHRDLDAAIEALRGTAAPDQLQLARLKKRKLRLKDEIALLEDQLIPDIIA